MPLVAGSWVAAGEPRLPLKFLVKKGNNSQTFFCSLALAAPFQQGGHQAQAKLANEHAISILQHDTHTVHP